MPRYLVERTFPDGFRLPTDGEGAQRYLDVVERNADDGVTWLHSYVSDDGRGLSASTTAPSPEAIRKTAAPQPAPCRPDHAGARPRPLLLQPRRT